MGGVPTKHHTRSKTGKRRSHLALKPINILVRPNCGSPVKPHSACPNCGFYKTKIVKQ